MRSKIHLVILTPFPFTERDFERNNLQHFLDSGFDVSIYDLTPVIAKALHDARNQEAHSCSKANYMTIGSVRSFKSAIKQLLEVNSRGKVVVWNKLPNSFTGLRIVRTLGSSGIDWFVAVLGALPPAPQHRISLIKRVGFALKRLAYSVYAPRILFFAGSDSLWTRRAVLRGSRTKLVATHSFDYDAWMRVNKLSGSDEPVIVHLEGASPLFDYDNLSIGRDEVMTPQNWYPALCRFFSILEQATGLKTVIAAHPKSKHISSHPDYYQGREVVSDNTIGMVNRARVVVTRASTAVSYAVIASKPIIFLTSAEIEALDYGREIASFAAEFGRQPVNIDEKYDFSEDDLEVDPDLYSGYCSRYLKSDDSSMTIAETMSSTIAEFFADTGYQE
jgi:hypothetical protein